MDEEVETGQPGMVTGVDTLSCYKRIEDIMNSVYQLDRKSVV